MPLYIFMMISLAGCAIQGQSPDETVTVSGTAAYRQRIAMSPEAMLTVILEDVSRADTGATVLAESKQAFGNRQVPLEFALQVPTSKIKPDSNYNLRAKIEADGQLRFITTRSYPVLTHGANNKANLLLDAVQTGALGKTRARGFVAQDNPVGETHEWNGEFRYMADAATFTDCASGNRWPIAMTGDYLATERAYLKARNVPGAPLMVTFQGKLEQRPSMEDKVSEMMVIEKLTDSHPGGSCSASGNQSTAKLLDTYWKLVDLSGEKIPFTPSHKRQIRITLASAGFRVIGFSGCNQFSGIFKQTGNELKFSQMAGTMMACVSPYMEFETKVLKMLNATTGYRIKGEQLFLLDGDKTMARFEALYLK